MYEVTIKFRLPEVHSLEKAQAVATEMTVGGKDAASTHVVPKDITIKSPAR